MSGRQHETTAAAVLDTNADGYTDGKSQSCNAAPASTLLPPLPVILLLQAATTTAVASAYFEADVRVSHLALVSTEPMVPSAVATAVGAAAVNNRDVPSDEICHC